MVTKLFRVLTVLVVCTISQQLAAIEENEHNAFIMGIPSGLTAEQQASWQSFIQYIETQTNYPLRLQTSASKSVFENRLFAGNFDLAYINPKLFIEANRYVGYQPVLKEGQKKLTGIIVVAKDCGCQTLKDLDGLRFVFPRHVFAASVVTRLNLYAQGLHFTNKQVETAEQSYAAVVSGSADAAGGVLQTFNALPEITKNKLRVLWTSKGISPSAFVFHPRVNATVRQRMVDAILSFKETDAGIVFYNSLQMNPFVRAENSDWNNIRQLMQ